MTAYLDDWLAGAPRATRSTYARILAGFLAHSKHDLEHATPEDVLAYHSRIVDQAPATVSTKLAALSSYFAYLRRRGVRDDDPMRAIPRRPKVQPLAKARWINTEDQRTLLAGLDPDEKRDRVLLWLLLHGLRVSEAVGVNIEDYRYGNLTVTGKGHKQRVVPIIRPAALAIDDYIGRRRSGPMLRGPHGRVSVRTAQRIVNSVTERVLDKKLNAHSMRHSFVTRMVVSGVPIAQVGAIAGHADLHTTQAYTHLSPEDLVRAMADDPLNESGELKVIDGGVRLAG